MKSFDYDFYRFPNSVAKKNSTVIFGGSVDMTIPVAELCQSLEFNFNVYNRSVEGLSIRNAKNEYIMCVEPVNPESVIIHIGAHDADLFKSSSEEFDKLYLDFISYLKKSNPKMRIQLVSVDNAQRSAIFSDMNRHIKAIASAERCEFFNIETAKLWNPDAAIAASFIYNTGFDRPLRIKRPLCDISKALFSYVYANGIHDNQDDRQAV